MLPLLPIAWLFKGAIASKKNGTIADESHSNKHKNNGIWATLFGASQSGKGSSKKLNHMNSSSKKVKPFPIPVTNSPKENNFKDDNNNNKSPTSNHGKGKNQGLRSSNFSKSLNRLEDALDALSSSAGVVDKSNGSTKMERVNSFQTMTTATANTSMVDNGSVYNQSVSIAMESSIDSDWMPASAVMNNRKNSPFTNHYAPSSRPRSLFFNVNGNLVQLSETITTISHC